jgi:deazaflavin-dependent oxidoreductase (nitroreductase family)
MSTSAQDFNARIIEEFRANEGRVGACSKGHLAFAASRWRPVGQGSHQPLVYNRDRDRYVVFASMAGAPTNPNWYHNLKANPNVTIEVGTDTIDAVASEATGELRDRLFTAQVERSPQFGEYQNKTDRVIPVIVLTPTV